MWTSRQGSEAKRRMMVTVSVAVISCLAVTLLLSRCLSFSLTKPVVTPGVWRGVMRGRMRVPAWRADSLLDCPTVRLHWITLLYQGWVEAQYQGGNEKLLRRLHYIAVVGWWVGDDIKHELCLDVSDGTVL